MNQVGTANDVVRERWIQQRLAELPEGIRLLDAGAGEQRYKKHCTHLKYVSQDFAEYHPQPEGSGLQMEKWDYGKLDIVSDITTIPEPDGAFDAILCSEVLEHIPSPEAAMREFSRLLRPGGKLLLTAPFLSLTHFAPFHFATGFNRYFYETHLAKCGFRIDEISANGNFFELVAQELRRVPTIGQRFANGKLRFYERWAMRIVLAGLARFSASDHGSHDLACYGLHIRATRLSTAATSPTPVDVRPLPRVA